MSDSLLAKWTDDRSSLTEEEAAELLARLESDPELARSAKDQLLADEWVSRRLASQVRSCPRSARITVRSMNWNAVSTAQYTQ